VPTQPIACGRTQGSASSAALVSTTSCAHISAVFASHWSGAAPLERLPSALSGAGLHT